MRPGPAGRNPERSRLWAARMTSAFRRAPRVPFRPSEKEPKVRLRGLHRPLRNPLENLASTRKLPPLPTGTQAVGTIQVAGAPNDENNGAASLPGGGTRGRILSPKGTLLKKSGPQGRVRVADSSRGRRAERPRAAVAHSALCARARRSRAVFRLPVGAARHAKAAVPPREHPRYGSGDLPAEALRPRRGGWRDAVNSFVHP